MVNRFTTRDSYRWQLTTDSNHGLARPVAPKPKAKSQEASLQSRIKRAGFPTDATLESYDWTRNPKTIRPEPFLELASGRYETSARLIETLNRARAVKALTPKVRLYCSYDLLVIDEFGFEKLERKEVPDALSLLYKVIDGRNRRSSTAIITNVNLEDWTDYLGDPPMTMALLDRVVDQTNVISFKGESIRKPKTKPEK